MRSIIILLILILLVSLFTACNPSFDHLESGGVTKEYFIETNQSCGWCDCTNSFNLTKGKATFSQKYTYNDFEDIPVKKITISDIE